MTDLEVKVTLNLSEIISNPEAKRTLHDALLCDVNFMNELIGLIVDGYTTQDSWPCALDLTTMRIQLLEGFKLTTQAELVRQTQSKDDDMKRTWKEKYALEYELKQIKDILRAVRPYEKSNVEGGLALLHSSGTKCPACDLITLIREV